MICRCGGNISEYDRLFKCSDCYGTIWKVSFGKKLSKSDIIKLFQGKTITLKGLKSSKGTLFNTKANIENKELNLIFDDNTDSTKIATCSCGGKVVKITKGYKCEDCYRVVWEKFLNRKIKPYQAKELFEDKSIELSYLKSTKSNSTFSATLYFVDKEIEIEYKS
jgi:hypothetical protein